MGNCTASEEQRAADATLAAVHAREKARIQKCEDDAVVYNTEKIKNALIEWKTPEHQKKISGESPDDAAYLTSIAFRGIIDYHKLLDRLRSAIRKYEPKITIQWVEKEGYCAFVYHGDCASCH
jgi:hypothetical protein